MPKPVCVAALGVAAAMIVSMTPESSADMTPELKFNSGVVVPASCRGERLPAVVRPVDLEPRLPARPMWLWDSPKVLLDAEARAGLFAFCACQGIDAIWMQVALERERAADGTRGAAACRRVAHAAARGPRGRADGRGARGRPDLCAQGAPRRSARRRRRRDRVQPDRARPRRLRRPALRHRAAQPLSLALPGAARADGRGSRRSRAGVVEAAARRGPALRRRAPLLAAGRGRADRRSRSASSRGRRRGNRPPTT